MRFRFNVIFKVGAIAAAVCTTWGKSSASTAGRGALESAGRIGVPTTEFAGYPERFVARTEAARVDRGWTTRVRWGIVSPT